MKCSILNNKATETDDLRKSARTLSARTLKTARQLKMDTDSFNPR